MGDPRDRIIEPQARESLQTLYVEHGGPQILRTLAEFRNDQVMPDDITSRQIADRDIEILEEAAESLESDPRLTAGVWDNDPDYPPEDWRYEVANGDTRLGYWDWVVNQKEQEQNEGP